MVQINPEPTPFDKIALNLRGKAGAVVPAWCWTRFGPVRPKAAGQSALATAHPEVFGDQPDPAPR